MIVGIVGHEAAKFTPAGKAQALTLIRRIIRDGATAVVSGGCHWGGVDIWAEEEADAVPLPLIVHRPTRRTWSGPEGYKARNIRIAEIADIVHVIVVTSLPPTYPGMRFPFCYHDGRTDHIKSGACWTAKYAMRLDKRAIWHLVDQ